MFEPRRDEGGNWQPVLAVRAAALTGAAFREIEGLLKTDVDPARMVLRLQQTKTGKSIRPIGAAALAVIGEASALSTSKYVFPSITSQDKHHVGLTRWLKRIAAEAVPGLTCTACATLSHRLRKTLDIRCQPSRRCSGMPAQV